MKIDKKNGKVEIEARKKNLLKMQNINLLRKRL